MFFMKKYIAEFLGVMLFVLIIGLSGGDALTVGIALAILVYVTGPLSGGHLNPAVTLSLAISKKVTWSVAAKYWIWQLIGGLLGALIYRLLRGSTMLVLPNDGVAVWQILVAEFIFTFLLAMVVYRTAFAKEVKENSYRGLAIGLTVFVGIMSVGAISAGVFNPAVAVGPILIDALDGGITLPYLWMFLVATVAGGAVAGWVNACNCKDK